MKLKEYNRLRARLRKATGRKLPAVKLPRGMNRNEQRFNRSILANLGSYEPSRYVITRTNERRYTPDFGYVMPLCPRPIMVEVKGGYKLQSEDRARLAWELAAEQNPSHIFVWARARKSGYECELWEQGGLFRRSAVIHDNTEFHDFVAGVNQ